MSGPCKCFTNKAHEVDPDVIVDMMSSMMSAEADIAFKESINTRADVDIFCRTCKTK